MSAEELRQAIEGPAHRGGWEFSPGLVELMLYDIGATEGHQPEPGHCHYFRMPYWRPGNGGGVT